MKQKDAVFNRLVLTFSIVLIFISIFGCFTAARAEAQIIPRIYVRKTDRDPFLLAMTSSKNKPETPEIKEKATPVTSVAIPEKKEVDSGFRISGIAMTSSGYQAIIADGKGKNVVVLAGNKIQGWTVRSITKKYLRLEKDNYYDILELNPDK
ncbi:MAG: hypothetical protein ACLFQV_04885 [Vulcanimicrobiota bacterium]